MARIALVYRVNEDDKSTQGIHQKMVDQAEAWKFLGHEVSTYYTKNDGLYRNDRKIKNLNLQKSISTKFWYFYLFFYSLKASLTSQDYDVIIFRYAPLSTGLNSLASKIKTINPEVRLIIDMPTYPYIKEYSFLKRLVLGVLENEHKKHKKHFDYILHLGKEETIFDIPTIAIRNGVNVQAYSPKKNYDLPYQKIRLIFVGALHKWQNLRSFLLSINEYFSEKPEIDLSIKIIGDGPELATLKSLVLQKALLIPKVFFIPSLYGHELDEYINESDLGVGYLGGNNRGVTTLSPLKHRHFAARGLPFIYRCVDEEFDNTSFAFKMRTDLLSKASIYQMVEWYLGFSKNYSDESASIRDFAEHELSWEKQCEKIIYQLNIL